MFIEHKTLAYKDRIIFEKLVMGNFNRVPKLFQETEACFMYLEEGSFQFRTPEKLLHFNAGDGLLTKCGDYFFEQTKLDHQNYKRTKAIGVYFYPAIIKQLFDFDLSISDFKTDYDATKVNIDELIKNFIRSIEFLLDNPSVSSDTMILTKLKEFLLLLSKTENAPSILDFVSALFKPYEYNFKKVIANNVFSNLSLNELANLCSLSMSSFQRKFSENFQQTPSAYFFEQRMKKAKELLLSQNNRISDIAYDCGYDSISTFNRVFKKHFECSPSKFRLTEIEQ
jgi:AraC-like DNA-binding protein